MEECLILISTSLAFPLQGSEEGKKGKKGLNKTKGKGPLSQRSFEQMESVKTARTSAEEVWRREIVVTPLLTLKRTQNVLRPLSKPFQSHLRYT